MIEGIIRLIVGVFFIVLALITSPNAGNLMSQVEHGLAICNSNLGRLGSLLSGNVAQNCQQVNQAPIIIILGYIAMFAFFIIGGYCIGTGGAE